MIKLVSEMTNKTHNDQFFLTYLMFYSFLKSKETIKKFMEPLSLQHSLFTETNKLLYEDKINMIIKEYNKLFLLTLIRKINSSENIQSICMLKKKISDKEWPDKAAVHDIINY